MAIVANSSRGGLGLFATRDFEEDETVLVIDDSRRVCQSYRAAALDSLQLIDCSVPRRLFPLTEALSRRREGLACVCIDTAQVNANIVRETDVWRR